MASVQSTMVFMLSVLGASFVHALPKSPRVGIVEGNAIDIEDAPYMAAVIEVFTWPEDIKLRCAGSIINPQFILTAAQCVQQLNNEQRNDLVVEVGSTTLLGGKYRKPYEIQDIFTHELFDGINFNYDIGLIKLVHPLTYSPAVGEIQLANEDVTTPLQFIGNITGWGSTRKSENLDDIPPNSELRRLSMKVRRPAACERNFEMFSEDKQICLWKYKAGPCIGDAGGPFTADGQQIGIVSRGETCGFKPTTVVKVAPFLEWIDRIIHENI